MVLPEEIGINPPQNPYKTIPEGAFDEGVIQDAPPERGKKAVTSGAIEDTIRPDFSENLFLQIEENFRQTGLGFSGGDLQGPFAYEIAEFLQNINSEGRTKLTAEEANKLYPGMPTPFTGEILPEVAQIRYENVQKRRRTLEWMARGPELGLPSQLLAGVPTFLEPVNLFATVSGAGLLAKFLPKAGLGIQIGANVAENLALDVPSYLSQKSRQQETQTLSETVAGSVGGGVGGTLFFKGLEFAGKKFLDLPDDVKSRSIREAIAQADQNKVINPATLEAARRNVNSGRTEGALGSSYRFDKFEDVPDRIFYLGARSSDGSNVSSDFSFGKGVSVIDDPSVVRNSTGAPGDAFTGTVKEVQIPTPDKLLDIDKTIEETNSQTVKNFLEKEFGKEVPTEVKTVKDALEFINSEVAAGNKSDAVISDLNAKLKSEGIEGYRYTHQREDGVTDNRAHLFDESSTKVLSETEVDRAELPKISDQTDQKAQDYINGTEGSKYADPDQDLLIAEMSTRDISTVMKNHVTDVSESKFLQANELLTEKAKTDPELKAELDGVNEKIKTDQKEVSLIKQMINCVLGSVT